MTCGFCGVSAGRRVLMGEAEELLQCVAEEPKIHGKDFLSLYVAPFWRENPPCRKTCTAERLACRNSVNGICPPPSATWRYPNRK